MNKKNELLRKLQNNEHILQVIPFDKFKKEWETVKGALKSTAQSLSPTKDTLTAVQLLKDFGLTGKLVLKEYGGKTYVILKGVPGSRKIFRGTRYLASNPKVVRMAVGPKGISKSVKGGFVLTIILCTGIEIFNYVINDRATLAELCGNITSDLIKIGISSICAAVAGLYIRFFYSTRQQRSYTFDFDDISWGCNRNCC